MDDLENGHCVSEIVNYGVGVTKIPTISERMITKVPDWFHIKGKIVLQLSEWQKCPLDLYK